MTSSETPTEPSSTRAGDRAGPATADRPATPAAAAGRRSVALPVPGWALALALVPPGWFFVLRTMRWHLTPSAILLMLCWAAICLTGYYVIRMALSVSTGRDEEWFAVTGRRDELEREKRSLLKAIKDIEFDRETGKLSEVDAAALNAVYRARAIEVIKAIETEAGLATTARERILADVRARAAIDVVRAKAGQKSAKAKAKARAAAEAKDEAKAAGKGDGEPAGKGDGASAAKLEAEPAAAATPTEASAADGDATSAPKVDEVAAGRAEAGDAPTPDTATEPEPGGADADDDAPVPPATAVAAGPRRVEEASS